MKLRNTSEQILDSSIQHVNWFKKYRVKRFIKKLIRMYNLSTRFIFRNGNVADSCKFDNTINIGVGHFKEWDYARIAILHEIGHILRGDERLSVEENELYANEWAYEHMKKYHKLDDDLALAFQVYICACAEGNDKDYRKAAREFYRRNNFCISWWAMSRELEFLEEAE